MEKFTLSNYFWALGVVLTRQNQVVVRENQPPAMALIPGWDMCNHEVGDQITTYQDSDLRLIEGHAKRSFQPGEEVTMFYGPRSNDELILYSGFVVDDQNPYNLARVSLRLDASDPLVKIRRMILQKEVAADGRLEIHDDTIQLQVTGDGSFVASAMLRALQVVCLAKESLTKALRSSVAMATDSDREQAYEWTPEEREAARTRHVEACAAAEEETKLLVSKVVHATHGALLQRYFQSQLNTLATAKRNDSIFAA